jgi:hypothetical protein
MPALCHGISIISRSKNYALKRTRLMRNISSMISIVCAESLGMDILTVIKNPFSREVTLHVDTYSGHDDHRRNPDRSCNHLRLPMPLPMNKIRMHTLIPLLVPTAKACSAYLTHTGGGAIKGRSMNRLHNVGSEFSFAMTPDTKDKKKLSVFYF